MGTKSAHPLLRQYEEAQSQALAARSVTSFTLVLRHEKLKKAHESSRLRIGGQDDSAVLIHTPDTRFSFSLTEGAESQLTMASQALRSRRELGFLKLDLIFIVSRYPPAHLQMSY